MASSKYEAQVEAGEKVKSFDPKKHEHCPCCGDEPFATWEPDEDDDPRFFIKCTSCSCQVSSSSWEECLEEWEGNRKAHWGFLKYDEAYCSNCGHIINPPFYTTKEAKEKWDTDLPKYCEECGAKMDHKDKEE